MANRGVVLEITDESGASRRMNLSGDRFVVGRLPELEVPLPADGVSRQHVEFLRDPGGRWWMRDLGSRNGTRVNGQKVAEAALAGGERIKIGPYVLRLLTSGDHTSPLTTIVGQVPVTSEEPGPLRSLAEMPAPQVQATHLSRLAQFGRDLSGAEDSTNRLRMLCELMTGGDFPGQWAVPVRVANGAGPVEPSMLLPPVYRAGTAAPDLPYLSSRLLAAVRQRRGPVMASNVGSSASDILVSVAPTVQVHTAVACPIGGDDQTLDVLYTALGPAGTTGEWLAVTGLAAEQYQQSESLWAERKLAAEHAVIQQELEQARKVQERLVPHHLTLKGVDCAVQFHPCRWVGGDYLDVIPVGGDRVVLVIADVCGHGMQAALLASTLHAVLNVLVPAGMELAAVLKNLNDYLNRTLQPGQFATALCVELEVATGRCRSLSAGHPPPFVIDPGGGWRALRCGEHMPLGVQEDQPLSLEEDHLPSGHVLALYTDGMFEVGRHEGSELGYRGLAQELISICRQTPASAAQIASRLVKFVEQLQGGGLAADDQSLLILRRP